MTAPAAQLDVGNVLHVTFSVIGQRLRTLGLIVLGYITLPMLIVDGLPLILGPGVAASVQSGASIATSVTTLIAQAAMIRITVGQLTGRPADTKAALTEAARLILPLFFLSLLAVLGMMVGLVLLVAPGVYLIVIWSLVIAVYVIERPPFFATFGRSAALVKGNGWRVLALVALAVVAFVVCLGGLAIFVGLTEGFDALESGAAETAPAFIVVSAAVTSAYLLVAVTGSAVMYAELRRLREGSISVDEVFA